MAYTYPQPILNNTDEILLKELKPKKVFYGDPLSFNKKSSAKSKAVNCLATP